MKDAKLLIWLTQLGIGIVVPLAGFIFLGYYLHIRFSLGNWVVYTGAVIGALSAIASLRSTLSMMEKMMDPEGKDKKPPTGVNFNSHD